MATRSSMRVYNPKGPFVTPLRLMIPKTVSMVLGVRQTTEYTDGGIIMTSFRTYGGTENFANDVYTIYDTAQVDTWYDPRITSDCHVIDVETNEEYEIISVPEDVGKRHQFSHFKVQKIGGKP